MNCRRLPWFPLLLAVAACGPQARGDDDGDDADVDASDCTPISIAELVCNNGADDDCDGLPDCADLDCSGVDGCPLVGGNCEVQSPSVSLSLPDGECSGIPPFGGTDAEIQAFIQTCSAYDGQLPLSGFPPNARLTDTSQFLGVCVKMEHSWLRDLQIEAYCPDGNRVILSKFLGQDCPNINAACEVFMGQPYDEPCDGDPVCTPVPGVGYDYCWTTAAANPSMLDFSNMDGSPETLPAGDYRPSEPFTGFANCMLNGTWRIRVVDAWGIDNGYIFESKLVFSGNLSDDCPVVE